MYDYQSGFTFTIVLTVSRSSMYQTVSRRHCNLDSLSVYLSIYTHTYEYMRMLYAL